MTTKLDRLAEEITGPLPYVEGSWSQENVDEAYILGQRNGINKGFKKAIEEASKFAEMKGYKYLHEKTGDTAALEVIKYLESFTEEEA